MATLQGPLQLSQAMETALDYMNNPKNAPWVLQDPVGAERQLKNQLAASLQWGFAIDDPNHPELRYFDQQTQFGMFNPDNRYYMAHIEFPGEYTIKGTIGTTADINIQIGSGSPGFDPEQVNLDPIALLTKADIVTDANGEFTILISDIKPNGRVNWMPNSKPCHDNPAETCGATSILIRESFMDWETEKGGTWYLSRTDTDGQPSPISTQDSLDKQYERAAEYLLNGSIGWVDFVAGRTVGEDEALVVADFVAESNLRANTEEPSLIFPSQGEDGLVGQFNSFGVFPMLNPFLAYIVSVKKHPNARYQGIQIGDLWFNSLDYCRRQTSLTIDQATESSDGLYHFVISREDPGVANWLDPSGTNLVATFLRWQGANGAFAPPFAPTVKAVQLAELHNHFPVDEPVFTTEQRQEQLAARQASCLGNPRGF